MSVETFDEVIDASVCSFVEHSVYNQEWDEDVISDWVFEHYADGSAMSNIEDVSELADEGLKEDGSIIVSSVDGFSAAMDQMATVAMRAKTYEAVLEFGRDHDLEYCDSLNDKDPHARDDKWKRYTRDDLVIYINGDEREVWKALSTDLGDTEVKFWIEFTSTIPDTNIEKLGRACDQKTDNG